MSLFHCFLKLLKLFPQFKTKTAIATRSEAVPGIKNDDQTLMACSAKGWLQLSSAQLFIRSWKNAHPREISWLSHKCGKWLKALLCARRGKSFSSS